MNFELKIGNSPSNCATEKQRIELVSHEQRENIAVKVDGNQNAQFRLKWCDDNNICKTSSPIKGQDSKDVYRDTVLDLLSSHVSYSGSFNVVEQKQGDKAVYWPPHEGAQHYWWKSGWKIINGANYDLQMDTPDVCMAYRANKKGFLRVHFSHIKADQLFDPNVPKGE